MSNDLRELIRSLIEKRQESWKAAQRVDERSNKDGVFTLASDAQKYASLVAEVNALDDRILELHETLQANEKAETYRADYEQLIAPNTQEPRMNDSRFKGPGFKVPYIRSATRSMSDEEVFVRDWLAGREPQSHFDVDFSGMQAVRGETGFEVRNDVLTTNTTVPTEFAPNLYRHIIEHNAVMSVASVDNYPHGRTVKYPKSVSAGTAAITGEGTAISENDPTFGVLTLDSWKYAQLLQISNELLEDVEFDILDFIAFDTGRAIGKASGGHFATGNGTNKPRGVITALANDLGTAVQVASATVEADNIIDLYYSVSRPYREGAYWLMSDSTAKAIRKLKNADDQYVWTTGLNGQPDEILGRPVLIDPAVASIGSANLSVAFFNPDAYKIRTQPLRFQRSDGFAFDKDLVTFRAVARMDGDLLDATATTGAVLDTD